MIRKEYTSDISRKQFEIIKEDLKSVRKTKRKLQNSFQIVTIAFIRIIFKRYFEQTLNLQARFVYELIITKSRIKVNDI